MRTIRLWDRPCPSIAIDDCLIYHRRVQGNEALLRMRSFDLGNCTGITFFIYHLILGVHIHTPESPYAQATFDQLSEVIRSKVCWIYVPFSKEDRVVALGTRMPKDATRRSGSDTTVLVRKKPRNQCILLSFLLVCCHVRKSLD